MEEFRCKECRRLLAKVEGAAKIEIKCPRCKTMNLYLEEVFITVDQEITEDRCTDPGIAER